MRIGKPGKTKISFKDFKKGYESAKSKSMYVINNFTSVKVKDIKELMNFLDENFSDFTNRTKTLIFKLYFDFNEDGKWDKLLIKWAKTLKDSNLAESQIELISSAKREVVYYKANKKLKDLIDEIEVQGEDESEDKNTNENNILIKIHNKIEAKDFDEAYRLFKIAIENDPKQSNIAYKLARHYYEVKDYKNANLLIEYALNAKPKNTYFINLKSEIDKKTNKVTTTKKEAVNKKEKASKVKKEVKEVVKEIEEPIDQSETLIIKLPKKTPEERYKELKAKEELKGMSKEFIMSIVNNKMQNEGYIGYYEENKDNIKFLYLLATSKYRLDDDTRSGHVKFLNWVAHIFVEDKDWEKAKEINEIALSIRPNNQGANCLKEYISNKEHPCLEAKKTKTVLPIDIEDEDLREVIKNIEEEINKRNVNVYINNINSFIKDSQFKYRYSKSIDKNAIYAIKEKFALDLRFIDLRIRSLIIPYFFKVEEKLIEVANYYNYFLNQIDETDSYITKEWYKTLALSPECIPIVTYGVFHINRLKADSIGQDISQNAKMLHPLLLEMFRKSRNFLVHSNNGLFNHQFWPPKDLIPNLDEFEQIKLAESIATEDARDESKIFHIIIILLVLSNSSKIAYKILSQIDYELFKFHSSISMGKRSKFYEAIGLKEDWFKNIVNFISENDKLFEK